MLTWINPPEDKHLQNIFATHQNEGVTFHLSTPIQHEQGYRVDEHGHLKTVQEGEDGYTLQKTSWSSRPHLLNQPIEDLIKQDLAFGFPFPQEKGLHPCLFLDRDGILIRDTGYPHKPEDLDLISDAISLIQKAQAKKYKIIIVTNQAGLAKKVFTEADYDIFTKAIEDQLRHFDIYLDGIYHCPWHEKGTIFRKNSLFRKPHPGMLLQACHDHDIDLSQSFMVGDKDSDHIHIAELKSFLYQGDYTLHSPPYLHIQKLEEVVTHL